MWLGRCGFGLTTLKELAPGLYITNFKEVDMVNTTISQHNRLLLASDNIEELESFGLVERTDD